MKQPDFPRESAITRQIIGGAIQVHKTLGPGLLESAYEACLEFELADMGLATERQKSMPIRYRRVSLDCGYRIDLVVEGIVVVEIKAVRSLDSVHHAQLLSYLKLSGCRVGLLINFHTAVLRDGIRRLVC